MIDYNNVDMGDELPTIEITPTTDQVNQFLVAWGNRTGMGRFSSPEDAKKEGFPDAIVPGIMSMAILSKLLTEWSDNVSIKTIDVVFRQPVLHNRSIYAKGMITDKLDERGENLLECDVLLEGEDGEKRVTGRAVLVVS